MNHNVQFTNIFSDPMNMAIDLTPDTDGEASASSSEGSPDASLPTFFDAIDPSSFELAQQLFSHTLSAMDDSTDLSTTSTTTTDDALLNIDPSAMSFEFITDLANQLNSIYGKSDDDDDVTSELNDFALQIAPAPQSSSMKEKYLGTITMEILGAQDFDGHLIPGGDVTLSKEGYGSVQIKALSKGEWSIIGQLAKKIAIWMVLLLDSPKVKIVAHLPNDLDGDLFIIVKFYLVTLPGATEIVLDSQELSAFQSLASELSKPLHELIPLTIKQSGFFPQPFFSSSPLSFSTNGLLPPIMIESNPSPRPSLGLNTSGLFAPTNPKKRDLAVSCPTIPYATGLKRPKLELGQRFLDTEFTSTFEPNPSEIQQLLRGMNSNHDEMPEMEPSENLLLTLRSYQKQALGWMVSRERSQSELMLISAQEKKKLPHPWKEYTTSTGLKYYFNPETKATTWDWPDQKQAVKHEVAKVAVRGGILADQMGMGKTIEILSLLLTNGQKEGEGQASGYSKTNLVVCPLSVLAQWLDEIRTHTATGKLSIYVYHGTNRNRDPAFLAQQDVVLTTYSTLAAELPSEKKTLKRQRKSEQRPALVEMKWYRVILDEAHTIKDRATRTAKAAFALRAERRWCVTGTPIQNKLEDLYSLFHFLKLEPYGELNNWNQLIMKPMRNKDDAGLTILQSVLEVILLRRTKDQRINNVPIVSLPPRIVKLRNFFFREEEDDFYQSLWSQSKTKFNAYVQAGAVLKNYAHILELLLRLRQACNHPYLVLQNKRTTTDISNTVQKYLAESRMGNSVATEQLKDLMNDWYDDECMLCLEAMEDPVVTPCGHLFCRNCIVKHLSATPVGASCAACNSGLAQSDLIHLPKKEDKQGVTLASITKSSIRESNSSEQLPWKSSTKIDALMRDLYTVAERDPTIKSIVFSQWTSMLDLVEIPLKNAGIRFVRLDGSMTQNQREISIRLFRTDPDIKIFLVSMKAGGLGLNLCSASHVYLLDPWWNPATEDQAIDRVHRLGQTRPVVVTRFIIQGTIEERILEMQKTKKQLAQDLMVRSKEARQIRIEELRTLFRD